MPIQFDPSQWNTLKDSCAKWWRGELDRPLMPITLRDRNPGRPEPDVPLLSQANCHDFTISADRIIDRIDYELSRQSFLGDAFPYFNMDCFGPGVIAAFLGARPDNSTGLVWFHPDGDKDIRDLHFRFDPDNVWFRRICELYSAGMRRWQGQVLMGMTDIGGNLDILSAFRPGEKLLLDLYDDPKEVKRLVWEAHEAWHQYYQALNSVLQPANPGYSDWSGMYSGQPSYILQCDFCYMIGTEMFEDFARPELVATCEKLENNFYHLDGIGQLPHLDSILAIPTLKGVQWVPGAGKPGCAHWPEVYRRIRDAGKLMMMYGNFAALDSVHEQLGSLRGIHCSGAGDGITDRYAILKKLEKYGLS